MADRRPVVIAARVTAAEHAACQEKAAAGVSPSALLRQAMARTGTAPALAIERERTRQIARIGNGRNQPARVAGLWGFGLNGATQCHAAGPLLLVAGFARRIAQESTWGHRWCASRLHGSRGHTLGAAVSSAWASQASKPWPAGSSAAGRGFAKPNMSCPQT